MKYFKLTIFLFLILITGFFVHAQDSKTFYNNPVIPGFNPDPSICKVGSDYYLVTSSFEYFPGVPVYHSTDLVHWEMIGHVLNRPSQLALDGYESSAGIYAPTIRYNNGTFYMTTTLVGKGKGNLICTATNPAGPWSEPNFIANSPGIDPDLLFDDDGKVYMTGSARAPVELWGGHKQIWTQELNINTWKLVGEQKIIFDSNDLLNNPQVYAGNLGYIVQIEGPHLYKKDGWYYGTFSHGGTGQNHAFSIFRSRNVFGPYEANPQNPILTHRDLPTNYPITATGHADLVQISGSDWAIVYLGKRPFDTGQKRTGGERIILGRETYMSLVDWSGDWPIVNPKGSVGRSELVQEAPNLPENSFDKSFLKDDFTASKLHPQWTFIRTPLTNWWSLSNKPGFLRMQLRPEVVSDKVNPSFIGKRQEDMSFTVNSKMDFNPQNNKEEAGLLVVRDKDDYIKYTVNKENNKFILKLAMRKGEETTDALIAQSEVETANVTLKIVALGMNYTFSYSTNGQDWRILKENLDIGTIEFLSGGRYTGQMIGMYASSNGQATNNTVDFDWFYYLSDGINLPSTTYFSQNFNSSTTLSDYFNATPTSTQFDIIAAASGTTSTVSINNQNQLVLDRAANPGLVAARTTNLAVPASSVYQMKFDFTGNRSTALVGTPAAQVTGVINVALGTGFNTDATGAGIPNGITSGTPNNAGDSYLQLRFTISNTTDNEYTIAVMNSSGVFGNNSAPQTGLKTIRYVMNSKGSAITYTNHLGATQTLASNKFDLYVDDILLFDDQDLTKASLTPTDFKISFSSGNLRGIATFDNFFYYTPSNVISLVPTPVKLVSFKGKTLDNSILLDWTTASEQNSSHFEVLHSQDGKQFSKIGSVQSAGNSLSINHYTFVDKEPNAAENYYQLKQIDKDGAADYSDIIVVTSSLQKSGLVAFATSTGLSLNIYAEKADRSKVMLSNINGQQIAAENVVLSKGYNNLNLNAALQPGIYIISMQLNSKQLTHKFIKP